MKRDDFDNRTKEILSKRVGSRCSNPNCRKLTSGPQKTKDKSISIGVAAHISAAASGGPRYDASMSEEDRKSIENGIWLCQNCGKLVDNDEKAYSSDLLRQWKNLSERAALLEIETNKTASSSENDSSLIKFYSQCFDRPAFQDPFHQEGSMEAFDKAIEDTITAINTGTLRARDGVVLSQSKGKSYLTQAAWREKMDVIVDLLRAIRERYSLAVHDGSIHLGQEYQGRQSFCINDRELSAWFDITRWEILRIFGDVCKEANIKSLSFPRPRRFW